MPRSKSFHLGQLLGQNSTIEADKLAAGAGGGSSVTAYATAAVLPLSGNTTGDQAFVSETGRLYIFTGAGWYNIALINTNPTITSGANASYTLNTDGTPTVITLLANDPEGVPITWSYSVTTGSLTNGGGTSATVTQVGNEFTITPTTTEAYAGDFDITFTASDGVNLATSASTFSLNWAVPPTAVEYLVVGGGGSGGRGYGGGGGAGGLLTGTDIYITTGNPLPVIVGAGGGGRPAQPGSDVAGRSGFDSMWRTALFTAIGGGAGGAEGQVGQAPGGSGGGGSYGTTPGAGTSGQGFAGSIGISGGFYPAGGGGGAGEAGGVPTSNISPGPAGAGGNGLPIDITGSTVYYAGGGGGGAGYDNGGGYGGGGGLGGGGDGAHDGDTYRAIRPDGVAGTPNTGGGGGGGNGFNGATGNGGSGVVILRYPDSYTAAASTTGSPTITVAGGYRVYKFTQSGSITF